MGEINEQDIDSSENSDGVDPATQAAECVEAVLDCEIQKRFWLKTIMPLLQLRSHESDPSPRVQLAFDRLMISACERATRILSSDLHD